MELNLKQSEIEAALRLYIANQGFQLAGRAVTVTFTAGRSPAGITAVVDIGDVTEAASTLGQVGVRTLEARPEDLQVSARTAELRQSDVQLGAAQLNTAQGQASPTVGDAGTPETVTEAPSVGTEGEAGTSEPGETQPDTPASLFRRGQ